MMDKNRINKPKNIYPNYKLSTFAVASLIVKNKVIIAENSRI